MAGHISFSRFDFLTNRRSITFIASRSSRRFYNSFTACRIAAGFGRTHRRKIADQSRLESALSPRAHPVDKLSADALGSGGISRMEIAGC